MITISKELVEQVTKMEAGSVNKAVLKNSSVTVNEKLMFHATKNDELTMATGNRKLGHLICGLSMPNIITCRKDAPCNKGCYCNKGPQSFSNIKGTYLKNLRLYLRNPNNFFSQLDAWLKFNGYEYCRFFDSGDIPSSDFFARLVKICNKHKKMKFLMYTKQYEIVNDFVSAGNKIPKNFKIYFSTWDKEWHEKLPNPYKFPIAYGNFEDKSLNPILPEKAIRCPGNKATCSTCKLCWTKDLPVIFGEH